MSIRIALLVLLLLPGLAAAQQIRPADRERLTETDALLGRALKQALAYGAAADIALLTRAMQGAPGDFDPAGDWNCRTLKLGGILPLVAYPDFSCRIEPLETGGWRLVKLTGSQRVVGTIHATGPSALFLGVGHVGTAPATDYAGLPPDDQTPVEPNQTTADVGWFEQMGPDRARLLLPDPVLESDFDILYLTRQAG